MGPDQHHLVGHLLLPVPWGRGNPIEFLETKKNKHISSSK
jgi:hypothetical protein